MKNNFLYALLIIIALIIADLFNLPGKVGISFNSLNSELWGLAIPFLVILITYFVIDEWQNQKEKNKVNIANQIVSHIYDAYINDISQFNDEAFIEDVMELRKADEFAIDIKYADNFISQYEYRKSVMNSFILEGILSGDMLSDYMDAVEKYEYIARTVITTPYLADAPDLLMKEVDLLKKIQAGRLDSKNSINSRATSLIEQLENKIKDIETKDSLLARNVKVNREIENK